MTEHSVKSHQQCEQWGHVLDELEPAAVCPGCGGLLELVHSPIGDGADATELKRRFAARRSAWRGPDASGVWRYRELVLPSATLEEIVTQPEGNTPLIERRAVSDWAGIEHLLIKHEGHNPTGSFKDRGMTVAITQARRAGARAVACASTGNTSASLAAYAAQAGMPALVFVPSAHVALGKMAQTMAYGATTLLVRGNFDACLSLVRKASPSLGVHLLNSINPFRIEGQKTIAFELLDQLDWNAPDWIALPAGNLGNTSAFGKALREAHAVGLIDRVPRLAAIQATGASQFAQSFRGGFAERLRVEPETVATAIRIGEPASWDRAVRVIRETNGTVIDVSDEEILEAKAVIDAAGIGCEPASAASVAGIARLRRDGVIRNGEQVVAILTGHLLKDPGAIVRYHQETLPPPSRANRPVEIDATLGDVQRALSSSGALPQLPTATVRCDKAFATGCLLPPTRLVMRNSVSAEILIMRFSCIARSLAWARSRSLLPSVVSVASAQRGGQGPDNRPEVTFPVTLPPDDQRVANLKKEAIRMVDSMATFTQQMVDQVFSFGELGMQEEETSKYLTGILEKNGFKVTRGIAGVPTAWVATWGSGKPMISLGSDVDDIPQANQKPGVGYHDVLIAGAPGHGEGHNSGVPLNITAAIAVKKIMERDHMQGTLQLWPGIAEEQMAAKAYFVREGLFKNVDVCLFTHVGAGFGVSYGQSGQNALISARFNFLGQSAHAAAAPWAGRSALDAVELMDVGWNFRREHLPLTQRSHYVITDGGDQPNVVPPTASVWYFFRETTSPLVQGLFALGDTMATAAAMMTGTRLASVDILGSGWSGHFNKVIASDMFENIKQVGMPVWSDADQTLAKGIQRELGQKDPRGLPDRIPNELAAPQRTEDMRGGGSDDIGDVSWNVPTVTLSYPSNIPGLPGHNWANAISMATPIAHKGVTAGAKAQAMTVIDLMLKPTVVTQAWAYFNEVQTKDIKYFPLMRPEDKPAIWLNKAIMDKYRPEMRKYYFDPTKYKTYLEQLGIKYPTVRDSTKPVPVGERGGPTARRIFSVAVRSRA